ncbi:PQQ-like beta-propeller repeat protein [soil metagenome]
MMQCPPLSAAALAGIFAAALAFSSPAHGESEGHQILIQGKGKLAVLEPDGKVSWEMPWGAIHDVHVVPGSGNYMMQRGGREVVEIDPATKEVVWSYESAEGNEVHALQPLEDGNVMIAESGAARIIEVDRDGTIVKEVALKVDNPHPHRDTRLARKLDSGNYLVCHEGDGAVREYDGESGEVVWEYAVPMFGREPAGGHGLEAFGNSVFGAVRLENGNTLIATGNGHSVLEVTPEKEIVWKIEQDDLAEQGVRLAWVTTLEVLPDGHYVIGNCHAGPENPILIELDPETKKVVWRLDGFEQFGNDVSNTLVLDAPEGTRR